MISTNDFHTGLTIELEGEVYTVVDFQHVKPGKGAAFVRSKLKNLRTGSITEKTFRAGEKVNRAHLERKEMEYLYRSGDDFYLMDLENYEQITVSGEQIGDAVKYLKENERLHVLLYGEKIMGLELPNTVELTVVDTEPGFKGDTAAGGSKPATLETGLVVQVPFFINTGDKVRIDTRSGAYIERA
ncbi:MAG TPA: elongation factor P [Bacillota bacterium]|jgi:elongation factor P|nr:elongation factor P [Bacillota bacterium]HOB87611.1 elongation factor P [Bacillota bacterium]HOP68930.1 elongation factor P [Bacillota bacterium]HPT33921.1 elongation factor P [Bacillota bacterium]HQD06132.1 elongation factor P [Bacillota bacterium]